MKEGRAEEAVAIRERTSQIKEQIKDLESQNTQAEEDLKALLYTIPNVPHSSVPKGRSAEDNELVLENGFDYMLVAKKDYNKGFMEEVERRRG
jgi:seryl-tRNA synthetase